MNDKEKGLEILKDTILNNISHPDYPRVNKLSAEYLQLFTGENIEELLKEFHKKTDDGMFEQVVAVYKSIMPEVSNNLAKIFSKIFRSNRIYSSIETKNSEAKASILKYAEDFWAGENAIGVDAYLASRWFHLQQFDPNAFIAVEFSDVNDVTKKTENIFPVEYSSKEVKRFNYINGNLDWLIVELPIKYRVRKGDKFAWKDGKRYIMYLEDWALQLTQVDPQQRITTANDQDYKAEVKGVVEEISDAVFIRIDGKPDNRIGSTEAGDVYEYKEFQTLAGRVPAKRVGYILDPMTNLRTCVSIFHSALPRFKKELKAGSELDLAVALHLHPQKIQFADPCEGDLDKGIICKNGQTHDGSVCSVCHGTGMKSVSTSSQDVIFVRKPRAEDPWPDLTKYVHYLKTDIDVIKFLYDMVNEITDKAKRAVFGSQAVEKKTVDKTATEMDYSMDDVYDTLHPFAMSYSASWLFIHRLIAVYSNNNVEDLTMYHRYPNDFKLKPLSALMEEAKSASESSLPQFIIDAINKDIGEILYADDKDTLSKVQVKNRFYPFAGKSQNEISAILLQNKTTRFNQVLYVHFNQVFEEIDNEIGDKFYTEFSYTKQKAEIEKKVAEITALIDAEQMARIKLETSIEGDTA